METHKHVLTIKCHFVDNNRFDLTSIYKKRRKCINRINNIIIRLNKQVCTCNYI